MGFSIKSIGKFIDEFDKVTNEVYKEASKEFDRNLKQVGKFIDNHYEYFDAVDNATEEIITSAAEVIGKATCYVINVARQIVDILFIKEQVSQRAPNALRAQILEKKKNAVDVGIFNGGQINQRLTINSDIGISNDIYKGQIIDLQI